MHYKKCKKARARSDAIARTQAKMITIAVEYTPAIALENEYTTNKSNHSLMQIMELVME